MSTKIIRTLRNIAGFAFASGFLLATKAAFASQGPGIAQGTASGITQLGMAVAVYGSSALVVVAGLIGAARHR